MQITIGTPHSGYFAVEYVTSLTATLVRGEFSYEVLQYESCYVHSNRNMIMRDARGDYLLFIDSDMCWNPNDISRLVKSGKDVIAGLYYKRRFPYGPVVYGHDGLTFKQATNIPERLFRCDGVGTGFLMLSRWVIDKFKDPELVADWGYAFDPLKSLNSGDGASFFNGEDLSWCLKARHLKMELWCDPETLVGHVGTQVIKGPL